MTTTTLHPPYDGGLGGIASKPATCANWRDAAACRGSDPGLFHGSQPLRARAICARCPVAEVCLWTAMVDEAANPPYRYGVWAGTTPARRERIAAELQLSAAGYEELAGAALEARHTVTLARGASHAA